VVNLYINNALAQTFAVPAGVGSVWTVFELNGNVVTPINTMGNVITSAIPLGPLGVSASRIPTTTNRSDAATIGDDVRKHPKRASSTPR
jgi:hypothetical protein